MNISEPSIVAYARLHGLTRPPSPGNPQIFKDAEIIKPPGGFDFPDDEAILQGLAGSSSSPERPSLDETDRDFLASIVALRIGRAKTPDQKSLFAGGQRRVDSPLLYTDHELDVIIHCKACDATLSWVAEPIASDCEKDEALDWPSWSFNTPTTYEHACRAEKLRIRQEAFMLLESAIYGPSVAHCEDECLYAFNKTIAHQPCTPPLFPITAELHGHCLSSPVAYLDIAFETSSPVSATVQKLEAEIFQRDELDCMAEDKLHNAWQRSPPTTQHCGLYQPTYASPQRTKPADLKVEIPLTPLPKAKAEIAYGPSMANPPLVDLILEQPVDSDIIGDEAMDAMFHELVEPSVMETQRRIENERLDRTDAECRVDVPILEFFKNKPSWHVDELAKRAKDTRTMMLPIARLSMHHWPSIQQIEHQLSWLPFPLKLGQRSDQETIETDDFSIFSWINFDRNDLLDDSNMTWKVSGLRILDENEDGEETLTISHLTNFNTLDMLLRKRKIEFDHYNPIDGQRQGMLSLSKVSDETMLLPQLSHQGRSPHDANHSSDKAQHVTNCQSQASTFSVSRGLHHFMQLQTGKPMLALKDPGFLRLTKDANQRGNDECPPNTRPEQAVSSQEADTMPLHDRISRPAINALMPRSFIMSSTLPSQRKLFQQIKTLYPSAELIERQPTVLHFQNGTSHKQSFEIVEEATIVVSPGLGLVCTTVAKVRQKSLPGEKGVQSFSERMITLAKRYEKLIVLVGASTIGEYDCSALNEIAVAPACNGVDVEIHVVCGGDMEMAHWIVAVMATAASLSPGLRLLEEETTWEQFLRRAGMNSFAAQVVLKHLAINEKPAFRDDEIWQCSAGITSFLAMMPQARLERFAKLLGGEKVLRRVNAVLDADWNIVGARV